MPIYPFNIRCLKALLTATQASKAPGQNLDRHRTTTPITWTRQSSTSNITLGKGSYGPPYTLNLNISSPFTLHGPDTSLTLSNSTLTFTTSDNFPYPLRSTSILDGHDPGHPGRIWTNTSSSSHIPVVISLPANLRIETDVQNGTRVWVNGSFVGRFEVFVFGGRNTLFSWSQMALVAPLESMEGGVDGILLEEEVGKGSGNASGGGSENGGLPVSNDAKRVGHNLRVAWLVMGMAVVSCLL